MRKGVKFWSLCLGFCISIMSLEVKVCGSESDESPRADARDLPEAQPFLSRAGSAALTTCVFCGLIPTPGRDSYLAEVGAAGSLAYTTCSFCALGVALPGGSPLAFGCCAVLVSTMFEVWIGRNVTPSATFSPHSTQRQPSVRPIIRNLGRGEGLIAIGMF